MTNTTTNSSHSPLQNPKQMNSAQRKSPRNPLSNLTNTIPNATSSSSSSTPTIKPISKASQAKNKNALIANLNDGAVSNSPDPKTPSVIGDGGRRKPGSVYTRSKCTAKSKLQGKDIFVNTDLDWVNESEGADQTIRTVEPRQKVSESGVAALTKSTARPPNKACESEVAVRTKSTVKPTKKRKRKTSSVEDTANYSLPQDFIEKQRAYFAEIDAFELAEEDASADDLE